tara:strand:- start:1044 stop:1511 length:468 start_codon:yes stop_codon:yes gene_type:complete
LLDLDKEIIMRKYLLFILFISIGLGQDTKSDSFVNESTFSKPKLYCSECKLSMRETITRYVCVDNHMSVKKSDVNIDKNGKLYIANSENNQSEYNLSLSFGGALIALSGAMGLYMNNIEFEDVDDLYDYMINDAQKYNDIRFGLLFVGGLLLLFD